MKLEISLRPLDERDADSVNQLLQSVRVNTPGLPAWNISQIKEEIVQGSLAGFLATGELAGFVFFKNTGDHIDISFLACRPDLQKHGIMTQIIKKLLEKSPRIPFWLEVHENNLKARKFYEKLQFKEVGRRLKYYCDNGTAILYSLSI